MCVCVRVYVCMYVCVVGGGGVSVDLPAIASFSISLID